MVTFRIVLWAALTIPAGAQAPAEMDRRVSPIELMARVFSPEFRRIKERLAGLEQELQGLPALASVPFASRYGFRSETLSEPEQAQWLQIDLMQRRMIDRLVAVPAHIPALGEQGAGYGFPRRFRIEVADNADMENATVVVDRTAADFANPGRYPQDFRIEPTAGRYVRFTSTRHCAIDDGFAWALEELIVLSGNQSVAIWRPVTSSSSLELFPNWSQSRVQDGQSALGLPVTNQPSPNRGYISAITHDPQEEKWLSVDLGDEHPIDEVRLVPVQADNFQTIGDGPFPRGWKVELATDPEFEHITWSFEMQKTNLAGYPGSCAILIPVSGKRGRHLRLVTLELWGRTAWQCGYGLAEIQAYAGNENVARGKPVLASDADKLLPGSDPAFATDGFSSRHRLLELPEYLDLIGRRGKLERERNRLLARIEAKIRTTGWVMGYGGGGLALLAVIGSGWVLLRQRTSRRQAMALLRDQIARDLHDDIGSNLGGIVLLSEIGSKQCPDPQSQADFQAIKQAADEASASMHDIVWLIHRGHHGLRDLVTKMRQSARMILGDREVSLDVEPPDFRDRDLSLFFRRHVFFAFKEALNNIRKHAGTCKTEVCIQLDASHLTFIIRDDGIGFDPKTPSLPGHGLSNLKRRAARLKGTCRIESQPGRGSVVTFSAPIKS
jgi:signal transduction histidine kinase